MPSPFDQSRYQVRFEWGTRGLARLAPADVVVVVDVLRFSSTVTSRVDAGETVPLDAAAHAVSLNGAAVARAAAATRTAAQAAALAPPTAAQSSVASGPRPLVLLGALRNASAVADAIVAEQHRHGDRTSVAVIAAGELTARTPDADLRVAVEDLLGAGAVIDALSTRGIDHTSPESAAARESFRGLRGAVRHLLTASGSGQELLERGARDEVLAAADVDASASVPALRDGVFVAY
ncbi:2-phosphosulfolactate phosphatase, partial [Microbacterium sp. bgisy203]|uniref:2-phosphosulfolactate phosphatase n=1 Tax=Microbacterium sp. bgisy203 TaxID=3413799 RepID=UPI003D70C0AD